MMPQGSLIIWKWVLNVLLALIVTYAVFAGYSIYRTVHVVIPHSYAAWTVGDLLVEYMETHNGNWPRGWQDLERAKDSLTKKGRNIYWNFDKLPPIVKIDWTVDPATLANTAIAGGESAVKVVTQLDGSKLESKWGPQTEPNRKIGRYLIQKYSTPSAIQPGSPPENTSPVK